MQGRKTVGYETWVDGHLAWKKGKKMKYKANISK
jgi:hypothetical protein